MKLTKYAILIAVIVVSMICQSCGGANSNTSGTLTQMTATTPVAAGDPITVSVIYSNTDSTTNVATLQGVPVTFTTNSASVSSGTASTDQGGTASVNLSTTNNISSDQTVVVTAHAGGITRAVTVVLKANQLTITAPSSLTGTFPAGTVSGIAPSGTFITYTDGSTPPNPLPNQPVNISVISLTPEQGNGTNVFWMNTGIATPFTLGVPITVTTDSHGVIDLSEFFVTSPVPASGDSTSVVVHFQAVANVAPGVAPSVAPGAVNITTDSTAYAFTFTGQ